MKWPWSRDRDRDNADLWTVEQRVAEVTSRGHAVAQSLEDRLTRNHFAALVAHTMTGDRT